MWGSRATCSVASPLLGAILTAGLSQEKERLCHLDDILWRVSLACESEEHYVSKTTEESGEKIAREFKISWVAVALRFRMGFPADLSPPVRAPAL